MLPMPRSDRQAADGFSKWWEVATQFRSIGFIQTTTMLPNNLGLGKDIGMLVQEGGETFPLCRLIEKLITAIVVVNEKKRCTWQSYFARLSAYYPASCPAITNNTHKVKPQIMVIATCATTGARVHTR